MAAPVYNPEGQTVDPELVAEAIATGRARFDRAQQYELLTPNGKPVSVSGAEVWRAIKEGFQLESDKAAEVRRYSEQAGVGEALLHGAERAASTATLGLSDVALSELGGEEYTRERALRDEALPTSGAVGDIAGLAVPFLGEVGLAGRAGKAALVAKGVSAPARGVTALSRAAGGATVRALGEGGSTLGRALRATARLGAEGAVEGAGYSMGRVVSEAALGDKELTAERLLEAGIEGGEVGGLIGGGLGLGGSLIASGARKLRGSKSLSDLAEIKAFKAATGATGSQIRKVGLKNARLSGRRLLDEQRIGILKSVERSAEELTSAVDDAGKEIGRLVEKVDATLYRPDAVAFLRAGDDVIAKLRNSTNGETLRLARQLEKDWITQLQARISKTFAPGGPSANTNMMLTFRELQQHRSALGDKMRIAEATARTNPDSAARAPVLRDLYNAFEREWTNQADAAVSHVARIMGDDGSAFAAEYQAAKARYADLITAKNQAVPRADMLAGNREFSLTDTMATVGGVASQGVTGLVWGAVNKAVRTYGDNAVALAANRLSKLKTASDSVGIKLSAGAKEALEQGAVESSVAKQLGSAASRSIVKGEATFEAQSRRVREYSASPERTAAKLARAAAPVANTAPGVAKAVEARVAGDMAALSAKLPKTASATGKVPASEQATFMRYARGIEGKLAFLQDFKDGRLSRETVEALADNRPALLRALRNEAIAAYSSMLQSGKEPSYQQKLQLAILLAQPVDPTMQPEFIRGIQAMHASRYPAAQLPPAPTMSSGGARDIAKRRETAADGVAHEE